MAGGLRGRSFGCFGSGDGDTTLDRLDRDERPALRWSRPRLQRTRTSRFPYFLYFLFVSSRLFASPPASPFSLSLPSR